jgi:DNA-binding CsgD family transcriptional regulator
VLCPNHALRLGARHAWRYTFSTVPLAAASASWSVCPRLRGEGKGPAEIAEALGVSRMSVWRALNAGRLEIAKTLGISRASVYRILEARE